MNELRGYTLTLRSDCDLRTETCCECGVLFAFPQAMYKRLLEQKTKARFYCPNGHSQFYTGKTEAQKLRDQLEREREATERAEKRARAARAEAEMTRNSLRVTKGHMTRLKKRIKHGVCPCCNRQFKNLARHMENKHPEYVGDISPDVKKARGK